MKKITILSLCTGAILFATTLFAAQTGEKEGGTREIASPTDQQRLVRLTRYEGQRISGVSASSAFDIQLVQSHDTKVVAEINEELEDRLELTLSPDGIVRVGLNAIYQSGRDDRNSRNTVRNLNRLNSRNTVLKLTVYLPELSYLKTSGAVTTYSTGSFNTRNAEISLSGASEIKSLDLNAEGKLSIKISGASEAYITAHAGNAEVTASGASDLDLNLSCRTVSLNCAGASDVTVTGEAHEGTITISGGSDVNAGGFAIRQLNITVSAASDVQAWAVERCKGKVSSAASLRLKGNPAELDIQSSSAGSFRRAD